VCVCVRACVRARDAATEEVPQPLTIATFSVDSHYWVIPFITSAFGIRSSLVDIATTLLAGRSGVDISVG
jgi:hypothetical protein